MSSLFVDTNFVVALVSERDQHHAQAIKLAELFDSQPLLTNDAVLFEIGNALARNFKEQAAEVIEDFLSSDEVEIIYSDAALFRRAFDYIGRTRINLGA